MSSSTTTIDFATAMEAYRATVDHPEQPCEAASELIEAKRPTWILRNSYGTLATVDAITGSVHGHDDQADDKPAVRSLVMTQADAAEVRRLCVQGAKRSFSRRQQ